MFSISHIKVSPVCEIQQQQQIMTSRGRYIKHKLMTHTCIWWLILQNHYAMKPFPIFTQMNPTRSLKRPKCAGDDSKQGVCYFSNYSDFSLKGAWDVFVLLPFDPIQQIPHLNLPPKIQFFDTYLQNILDHIAKSTFMQFSIMIFPPLLPVYTFNFEK